jgi:carotenoid cleavage dioxygenase-like enzyme
MIVERLAPVVVTLQASNHPYLNGAWTPQREEFTATDLDVIEGAIPADLDGVYLRNTQNPVHNPLGFYHPFDGDGMIHQIEFVGGKASYRNRFVRTRGFQAEQEAEGPLWAGFADSPFITKRGGVGFTHAMKDNSSTDIVVHAGKAMSLFYMCGEGYRLDPLTLETVGLEGWVPIDGISAHAKVNEATGELYFFNYSAQAPHMHYGVVDKDNRLVSYMPVPLPGPRVVHDMAFSEHWSILNDFPVLFDPNGKLNLRRDMPSRFALVPRDGKGGEVRWFDAAPTFVEHWLNAYEEGDEVILDGYFQDEPVPDAPAYYPAEVASKFAIIDCAAIGTRLHRWRFNLVDGTTREENLDKVRTNLEFGMFNPLYAGRKYRYAYSAMMFPGMFLMNGWVKHDLETGESQELKLAAGRFCSETPFAPRVGGTDEDDGYLISFIIDENTNSSECWIIDAKKFEAGPVARIRLPAKISSGTHSCWAGREQLGGA